MEKLIFKNAYLNAVLGFALILFAVLAYFLKWVEDFLPIIVGVVLILLSTKRFIYSFKKIVSKNATLILVLEFILDLAIAGLLIYLQDHVELGIGLIIYIRGVSYLLINYIATRKIKIFQYVLNIFFVTLGSFFMFYDINSVTLLSLFIVLLMMLVGGMLLQAGMVSIVKKEKEEQVLEDEKKEKTHQKIEKLEQKVKETEQEKKVTLEENKKLEQLVKKTVVSPPKDVATMAEVPKTAKTNYSEMTIAELKTIAKQRNITGVSQLNKAELIAKLK